MSYNLLFEKLSALFEVSSSLRFIRCLGLFRAVPPHRVPNGFRTKTGYRVYHCRNSQDLNALYDGDRYADWCVIKSNELFRHYTGGARGKPLTFYKEGFERIQRPDSQPDDYPLDSYGVSMLVVIL